MAGRILIADDVATNRIIMKVKLSAASYEVIQAESGAQVIALATENTIDLFVLDVVMPGIDGIDLCKRLRANPATRSIPIILVSSKGNNDTRLAALAAGADEYLEKPIDERHLLARIRNLLRSRVIGDELKLRQGTALELGFAEARESFAHAGSIALIAARTETAIAWSDAIENDVRDMIEVIPRLQVLETLARCKTAPDVIVIPATLRESGDGLTLLSELRCRPKTRHSAIIVVHDAHDKSNAIAALDMGANDLLTSDCDPCEMILRIRAQMKRKLQADKLRETLDDGLKMAVTDPLTGLFNRRYALPHLSRIANKAMATGRPFAVMVLDMDHFKRINDTYGHSAGDAVLSEVSERLKSNLRNVDLVARIGGEEFLVVLPDTDLAAARITAERLRVVTQATPVALPDRKTEIAVTVSIGVSIGGYYNADETPVQVLVDQADHALMGAKSEGRNQVTFDQTSA